jgi:hypothetical protein
MSIRMPFCLWRQIVFVRFVYARFVYARFPTSRAAAMLSILVTAVGSSAQENESAATVT